jgi:hypothetical protein
MYVVIDEGWTQQASLVLQDTNNIYFRQKSKSLTTLMCKLIQNVEPQ